jgi:hypothetical protein
LCWIAHTPLFFLSSNNGERSFFMGLCFVRAHLILPFVVFF